MKKLNSIKNKTSEEDSKVSVDYPLKLLVEFFDGLVIKVSKGYVFES